MRASPIIDQVAPVAVVCHDAGAANIIFCWLSAAGTHCRVYLEGPAAKLWTAAFPTSTSAGSLEAALEGSGTLISGTGWASDLEHRARVAAQLRSIHSIAVLDHWVNYAERFERDGTIVLPDEIWVTDSYAWSEANRKFPNRTIRRFENPYAADQLGRIGALPRRDASDILYVMEPARSTWGRRMEGEFQALDYFVEQLPRLKVPSDVEIRLRPHPSDVDDKYNSWIEAHPDLNVRLDRSADMAAAISGARWVAGCESFALVLALEADRTVFCTLPPWAPACRLPHTGLVHLKALEL